MDLKLLLQYPKAVQVLLAALQKSPASLPKLEKLLPPEIPAAALLSAMEQAGFLTKTGSRYVLQQEALEQMQQFLQLYAAVQNRTSPIFSPPNGRQKHSMQCLSQNSPFLKAWFLETATLCICCTHPLAEKATAS